MAQPAWVMVQQTSTVMKLHSNLKNQVEYNHRLLLPQWSTLQKRKLLEWQRILPWLKKMYASATTEHWEKVWSETCIDTFHSYN